MDVKSKTPTQGAQTASRSGASPNPSCTNWRRKSATRCFSPSARALRLGTEQVVLNTSAVSVPVFNEHGEALAAVTVAAMADRLSDGRLDEVVAALQDTVRRIARRRKELATRLMR